MPWKMTSILADCRRRLQHLHRPGNDPGPNWQEAKHLTITPQWQLILLASVVCRLLHSIIFSLHEPITIQFTGRAGQVMEEVDLQYRKDDSCEGTLAIYLNYLRMGYYCIGSTVPDGPTFSRVLNLWKLCVNQLILLQTPLTPCIK